MADRAKEVAEVESALEKQPSCDINNLAAALRKQILVLDGGRYFFGHLIYSYSAFCSFDRRAALSLAR
jgi:hypothetical protein